MYISKSKIIIAVALIAIGAGYTLWSMKTHSGNSSMATRPPKEGAASVNRPTDSALPGAQGGAQANGAADVPRKAISPSGTGSWKVEDMNRADLAVIANSSTPVPELISALMRLATRRLPEARDEALELSRSGELKLKVVAIRALGYFDEPEANKRLKELLEDTNPIFRQSALQALTIPSGDSQSRDNTRKNLLEEYLAKSQRNDSKDMKGPARFGGDQMVVMSSLYRMSDNPQEKQKYFDRMLNSVTEASKSNTMQQRGAVQFLKQINPKDERVMALERSIAAQEKEKPQGRSESKRETRKK